MFAIPPETSRYGGIKAARLQAVVRDISLRLSDPDISAASVGHRLGLS